jgi:hypothetical protein
MVLLSMCQLAEVQENWDLALGLLNEADASVTALPTADGRQSLQNPETTARYRCRSLTVVVCLFVCLLLFVVVVVAVVVVGVLGLCATDTDLDAGKTGMLTLHYLILRVYAHVRYGALLFFGVRASFPSFITRPLARTTRVTADRFIFCSVARSLLLLV